ncbi:MAG: VWA domain-containing protein [Gemmataceae bacterium]|nr:VWA domain-containing protein [Gemmataceae bacterium]
MRTFKLVFSLLALGLFSQTSLGRGLLIPEDKKLPPLAMLNHKVDIRIDDQIAITRVEQTFRNHTDRALEATYIFPVPKGASVTSFTMWVDGKETKGELMEAAKAREIYTSIVRQTQDPGLLEYLGNNLMRMRIFPVPPKGDQKVSLTFTSVSPREGNGVEFTYPMKSDARASSTLENFTVKAVLKSQHGISNVYSPSHAINMKRENDKEVVVQFEKGQALLDRDFQLFYTMSDKDIGLTVLNHRPVEAEDGFFSLLISPSFKPLNGKTIPRDMVFVMDTSGSMRGVKMDQARKAMRYCVENLAPEDRFAVLNFSTTVNSFRNELVPASKDYLDLGRKWIDGLESTGGTAIRDALLAGINLKSSDPDRPFVMVFFTDGMPTIGETNPDKILKEVSAKITGNMRIFTFGVGDDVNTTLLDSLAEQTKALPTYVRPNEDIEIKASSLLSKITNPVLVNLKLETTADVRLLEVYPPQLPDLFHGSQLVVFGRYKGKGATAITLKGNVGKESKSFTHEFTFASKTSGDREFVEQLWARRKVGFLVDQIRTNGEKKELVEEVTLLAKKYGITTPYTSYLVVPDGATPAPVARAGRDGIPAFATPPGLGGGGAGGPAGNQKKVLDFARENQEKPGKLGYNRGVFAEKALEQRAANAPNKEESDKARQTIESKLALDRAKAAMARRDYSSVQGGKLGVDLSVHYQQLRNESQVCQSAVRQFAGRNLMELGGVWIDEGFNPKMKSVTVRAQSDAYFKILEQQPKVKALYQLGNHLVWVTPNQTALVIDTHDGVVTLSDKEIADLFAAK